VSVAGNFGDDPRIVEKARLCLAGSVLSVATEDSRDPKVLEVAALEAMALDYRPAA
jgi:hypothetical protein